MKKRIIEIIENLTEFKGLEKNPKIDLIEEDILDSLSFIELIAALEDEYNIEIQPTQVDADSWRSVENIAKLVKKLEEK
ncbi:MAG: hypothetical protein IJV31_05315 [Clostridia bacterium]|nr:hypothetical protein [Clostridia bacterium]